MKMEADYWLAFSGAGTSACGHGAKKLYTVRHVKKLYTVRPAEKLYTVEAGAEKLGTVYICKNC